jgi:hypothetical protein
MRGQPTEAGKGVLILIRCVRSGMIDSDNSSYVRSGLMPRDGITERWVGKSGEAPVPISEDVISLTPHLISTPIIRNRHKTNCIDTSDC